MYCFRHHEHGAVSIYNSENITVKNCTFHNNTSDSYFTRKLYQGSAGALSIGYHYVKFKRSFNSANILIISCKFNWNSAIPTAETETPVLHIFPGRGGALSVLVNIISPFNFVFNNSIVMNSYAKTFGGGMFCYTQRGYAHQTYTFANNIFTNNTSPQNGGLAFVNLSNRPVKSVIISLIYNCTFTNNTATPGVGGATGVYPFHALANNKVVFKDCKFYDNSALMNYGGAVDITSYNYLDNRLATFSVEFINWLVVMSIAFVMYMYYCQYMIAYLMVTMLLMVVL